MVKSIMTATLALATLAPAVAFAEGCSYGHYGQSTVAEVETQSTPGVDQTLEIVEETTVAVLSCAELTGDALAACLAAQATN